MTPPAGGDLASDAVLARLTSLHPKLIDLSLGKRLELEALQGAVVRRGRAVGVPTPIMDTLYAVLKPWAAGPVR